jgi:integration host factor subunit alpha
MTLTKANLVEKIVNQNGLPRNQSREIIETLVEAIKHTLESGEDVLISGFGKFCLKEKRERRGRNPETGQDLIIPPRRVVTFKSSRQLRDKINRY